MKEVIISVSYQLRLSFLLSYSSCHDRKIFQILISKFPQSSKSFQNLFQDQLYEISANLRFYKNSKSLISFISFIKNTQTSPISLKIIYIFKIQSFSFKTLRRLSLNPLNLRIFSHIMLL